MFKGCFVWKFISTWFYLCRSSMKCLKIVMFLIFHPNCIVCLSWFIEILGALVLKDRASGCALALTRIISLVQLPRFTSHWFRGSNLCRLALGLLFGIVSVFWVGLVFNDTIIEITLTLTASYMAFFVVRIPTGVWPSTLYLVLCIFSSGLLQKLLILIS